MSQQDTKLQNCEQKLKELVASIVDLSSSNESSECERFIGHCEQSLKWLKRTTPRETKANDVKSITECPSEFLCPISKKIMTNPVVVVSGVTYDKESIVARSTCPVTLKKLDSSSPMIPNILLLDMIMMWCSRNGGGTSSDDEVLAEEEQKRLVGFLKNVQSTISSDRLRAAQMLRALTCLKKSHRLYFSAFPVSVSQIVTALLQWEHDGEFEENLLYMVNYIALQEETKETLGESITLLTYLANGLDTGKSETVRSLCASTLNMLSCATTRIREEMGCSGAVKALLSALKNDNTVIERDVVMSLLQLCEHPLNVERVIAEGGVELMYKKISDGHLVVDLIHMLVMITNNELGSIRWRNVLGIKLLALVLKGGYYAVETVTDCVDCLLNVYRHDSNAQVDIKEDSELVSFIRELAENKTSNANAKARDLWYRIDNTPFHLRY